jgi:hypothetical protein
VYRVWDCVRGGGVGDPSSSHKKGVGFLSSRIFPWTLLYSGTHTHTHTHFTHTHTHFTHTPPFPPSIPRTTHHLPWHPSSKSTRSAASPHSRAFSHPLYIQPVQCLSAASPLPPLTPRASSHHSHRARGRARRSRRG